jgi:hypothetical protein
VRTSGDPARLTTAVRRAVASVDPTVPVPSLSIFDDLIAQKSVTRRLSVLLVSVFSGVALFLSAIGCTAFITGQLPVRTGLTTIGIPGSKRGIQKEDPTLAEVLKSVGYPCDCAVEVIF